MDDRKESKTMNEQKLPNGLSRRNLIRGMSAAPIVLSVSSRPVWAAGCTISGHLSGNLSNPQDTDCTSQAEGKSPDYWCKWKEIYDLLKSVHCAPWGQWDGLSQDNIDALNLQFGKYNMGEGTAINVLYNWSVAASANTDGRINLHPTDASGQITSSGSSICNTGNQVDRHMTAGLLSAAHPSINFPYSASEWTVSYMLDKYLSPVSGEPQALDNLLRSFFTSHAEPGLMNLASGAGISSASAAYTWAINYLNLNVQC